MNSRVQVRIGEALTMVVVTVTYGGSNDLVLFGPMEGFGSEMNMSVYEWYHMHMSCYHC